MKPDSSDIMATVDTERPDGIVVLLAKICGNNGIRAYGYA